MFAREPDVSWYGPRWPFNASAPGAWREIPGSCETPLRDGRHIAGGGFVIRGRFRCGGSTSEGKLSAEGLPVLGLSRVGAVSATVARLAPSVL